MTNEEMEILLSFLGGYWYDREEEDATIVREIQTDFEPDNLKERIRLIQKFLAESATPASKAKTIRSAVWRWFPPDDDDAPIRWLKEILSMLKKAETQQDDNNTVS